MSRSHNPPNTSRLAMRALVVMDWPPISILQLELQTGSLEEDLQGVYCCIAISGTS
jgi:hypothetical protein